MCEAQSITDGMVWPALMRSMENASEAGLFSLPISDGTVRKNKFDAGELDLEMCDVS